MDSQFLMCYPSARYTSLTAGGTPHGQCVFVVFYEGQGERMTCRVVIEATLLTLSMHHRCNVAQFMCCYYPVRFDGLLATESLVETITTQDEVKG